MSRNDPPASRIQDLVDAAIDGHLSQSEQAHLDQMLARDPALAARLTRDRHLSALLAQSVPDPDPDHLSALLARACAASRTRAAPALSWRVAAAMVFFAAGLGTGLVLPPRTAPQPIAANTGLDSFARQAKAAHLLYVGEVLHPVEVAGSEQDHLQTWLSKRLGATVIAPRLEGSGFTLIGGRLLPAGDRASALFMYENDRGDRISLLATHGPSRSDQSFRYADQDGALTISWQDGPWSYALVGALSRATQDGIARDIQKQMI